MRLARGRKHYLISFSIKIVYKLVCTVTQAGTFCICRKIIYQQKPVLLKGCGQSGAVICLPAYLGGVKSGYLFL